MRSQLTRLQTLMLREFFARERRFFLTGGAALAGYYLGHRVTDDLDLFTTDAVAYRSCLAVLREITDAQRGTLVVRQDSPRFRRVIIEMGGDQLVVDCVHDGPQAFPEKPSIDDVRVDPPAEILINKLCAIVGRSEERDLVDVMLLERTGLVIEDVLPLAQEKDGGCTAATLAWLLSELSIPDELALPAGVAAAELRDYVAALVVRLRRAALPK